MKIKILIALTLALTVSPLAAQEMQTVEFRLPEEILGYRVLKCDFHLHTIFSDGTVWPTVRVDEAAREGLDVIAITEHAEFRPLTGRLGMDEGLSFDLGYRIAKPAADAAGLLLIPAIEVTKAVPPGHFNALFITDFDRFKETMNPDDTQDPSYIRKALGEARRQGAFIFWNHPWFRVPDNESIWFPIIDSLYNEGYIDGVEVVNATKYDPVIFDWVQSRNLANIANTDLHAPSPYGNPAHRTMTIVFARERSIEGVREALDDRRSISYCKGGMLIGERRFLEEIFHRSIRVEVSGDGKNRGLLKISNDSSVPFEISFTDKDGLQISSYTNGLTVPPLGGSSAAFSYRDGFETKSSFELKIKVENLEVAHNTPLETAIRIVL